MRLLCLFVLLAVAGAVQTAVESPSFAPQKAYGRDYFNRLRGGSTNALVESHASMSGAKCAVLGDIKIYDGIFNAIG